jgi:hypothetical protein
VPPEPSTKTPETTNLLTPSLAPLRTQNTIPTNTRVVVAANELLVMKVVSRRITGWLPGVWCGRITLYLQLGDDRIVCGRRYESVTVGLGQAEGVDPDECPPPSR